MIKGSPIRKPLSSRSKANPMDIFHQVLLAIVLIHLLTVMNLKIASAVSFSNFGVANQCHIPEFSRRDVKLGAFTLHETRLVLVRIMNIMLN